MSTNTEAPASKPIKVSQASVKRKLEQGLHSQGWMVVGRGGTWTAVLKPLMEYLNKEVTK